MQAKVRDKQALREWIEHRGSTLRKVADAATRIDERERGAQALKVNHSTVGHLVSGVQRYVSPRRAELIEKALDVPRGSLFTYELATVTQESRRSA